MYLGAIEIGCGENYNLNNKANHKENSNTMSDFATVLSSKDILHNKIEEMHENIEAGNVDFDPIFQIGGKAYTEEEWNKLLERVDEAAKETQEALEEEIAKILEEKESA